MGVGLGGDDDDRHDRAGADLPADVEALDVGQPKVDEDEVGLVTIERGETLRSGPGLGDAVALVFEGETERQADLVVVFDEQQLVHRGAMLRARAGVTTYRDAHRRPPRLVIGHGIDFT